MSRHDLILSNTSTPTKVDGRCTCGEWFWEHASEHIIVRNWMDHSALVGEKPSMIVTVTTPKENPMPQPVKVTFPAALLNGDHVGATLKLTTAVGVILEDRAVAIHHTTIRPDIELAAWVQPERVEPAVWVQFERVEPAGIHDAFRVHPETIVTVVAPKAAA